MLPFTHWTSRCCEIETPPFPSLSFPLDFLCPLEANVFGINFTYFKLREMNSGKQIIEVAKSEEDRDKVPVRTIRYVLPEVFLDYTLLGAT